MLDHHLYKGVACVAHIDPYYDNLIISLSLQLEPEITKLITVGRQIGNTSEEQPRGKDKNKEGNTMKVLKFFSWVLRLRTVTMGTKEAPSWVFVVRRESEYSLWPTFEILRLKLKNSKYPIWSNVGLLMELRNSCVKKNALIYNKN